MGHGVAVKTNEYLSHEDISFFTAVNELFVSIAALQPMVAKMDLLANLPPLAAVLVNVMLGRKHKYLITN